MNTTIKHLAIVTLLFILSDNVQAGLVADSDSEGNSDSFVTCTGLNNSGFGSAPDSLRSRVVTGGTGLGYMMKGGFFGLNGKFIAPNGWGGSLDLLFGESRTKNVPSDYNPIFEPVDNRTVFSAKLVKVITEAGVSPRFSLGIGPSMVSFDNTKITPNPNYNPESIFHLRKYFRSRDLEKAIGLLISAESEIPLATFMSMDFLVFANLNKLASFVGFGLFLNFGDVR